MAHAAGGVCGAVGSTEDARGGGPEAARMSRLLLDRQGGQGGAVGLLGGRPPVWPEPGCQEAQAPPAQGAAVPREGAAPTVPHKPGRGRPAGSPRTRSCWGPRGACSRASTPHGLPGTGSYMPVRLGWGQAGNTQ